jgi:hypothetical protein
MRKENMISLTTQVTYREGKLVIELPPSYETPIASFIEKLHGAPAIVSINKWYKSRTTGKGSQSAHLNGHIQQIALETGNDFSTVKLYIKTEAISRGFPFDTIKDMIFPWSETRINTVQCSLLIDGAHMLAAEYGINLYEGEGYASL